MKRCIWFSWKDLSHPRSGGAEVITDFHLRELVKKNYKVYLMTSSYDNAKKKEFYNGYTIIRHNKFYSCQFFYFWWALLLFKFKKNDYVVEEINTIPFLIFLIKKDRLKIFYHQLTEKIWFFETIFPISIFGFIFEKIILKIISLKKIKIIVPSKSTKKNISKYNIHHSLIKVVENLVFFKNKFNKIHYYNNFKNRKIITFIGEIRRMKRIEDLIEIYLSIKKIYPEIKLHIVGKFNSKYAKRMISKNPDISFTGFIEQNKKNDLLKKSSFLVSCSVKEGWGLTITEANKYGTPALVYNVDGLRDSVTNNKNGIIVDDNNKKQFIKKLQFYLDAKNTKEYMSLRESTYSHFINSMKNQKYKKIY